MARIEIDYNKIYYNSQNKAFRILKELPSHKKNRMILVKFIESGYETEVTLSRIMENPISIADHLSPSVYGVGIVGYAQPKLNRVMYKRWADMLSRCYNPNNDRYSAYGDEGVTVCERWMRFDYFLEDIVNLPGYQDMINNPNEKYQLDKDVLQQGCINKVYGPETCMFIPESMNNTQRFIDNKENYKQQYFGVQPNKANNYTARIKVDHKNVHCGTYDDPVAAACAYNYYATVLGRPALNEVPYNMTHEEFASHLVKPIPMLVEEKEYGVSKLKNGNYIARMSANNDAFTIGTYTNKNAALNAYNHFAIVTGNPNRNNVPYMSPQECSKYMVNPRSMCTIVS